MKIQVLRNYRLGQNLYELFIKSKFNFFHADKLNYEDFILKSIECLININPPGIGEYTSRMFDHSFLGLPVVMRKTSYDFGISYKEYFPQIDFRITNWESKIDDVLKILMNGQKNHIFIIIIIGNQNQLII